MIFATFLGIGSLREVAQAIVSGVVAGSSYALLGVAFALVLGVTGRFHFAFAIVYTFTAYVSAVVLDKWGLPLLPACLFGLAVGVVLGATIEALVYRPLAARAGDNALLGVFVAALGLVIAGENFIRLVWGNNTRNMGGFPEHTYTIANVNFTLLEATLVVLALVIGVGLTVVLNRTILGQQIKAVRGNAEMAQAVGVDVRRIFLVVFAIGSLIGGIAAVFAGMRFAAAPDMGNTPVFYAFVVAFVAGVQRSPLVVVAVGFGIGVVESLSTLWVSDNLSALTVFGLLCVWLTVRVLPQALRQLSGAMSRTNRAQTRARASRASGAA
ncbi:MAG TPA: branched-chain amino acid ABC transporter permease [Baekduia sp.]|uniref:branched-chain amino acid ABC transporter permease n=1 Tax=Baekduia sp. TaxID=2600305 RepID=UPI002C6DB738|nr:branched-chain amino acid ABC transporter permease [Baekduia sp.]HMJ37740.1 branched-chain amino acid ABC transporter permease [Baekduia sp.]